jgi:Tfp pilus assembly protein PilN
MDFRKTNQVEEQVATQHFYKTNRDLLMLTDTLKKVIFSRAAYGLDCIILPGGELSFQLIKTSIKKQQLEVEEQQKDLSIETLTKYAWTKSLPVELCLRGKGVLQKRISCTADEEDIAVFRKTLPNAKLEDFYFQLERINEEEAWVAVARREQVEEVLKRVNAIGLHVIGLELGLVHLNKLHQLLDLKSKVSIGQWQLRFENKKLQALEAQKEELRDRVQLGTEWVDSSLLPAFSASIAYHGFKETEKSNIQLEKAKEEYKNHRIFRLGGWALLIFILGILLINFLLFQHYNDKSTRLSGQLALNSSLLEKLEVLKKEYDRNALFFNNTGLITSSRHSFYADRLAESLPSGVFWNKVALNPPKGRFKKSDDVAFTIGVVEVEGVASNSGILNRWISRLEKEEWVKSIAIKDYQEQEKTSKGAFKLSIQIQ